MESVESLIPILFKILFGFVALNAIITLILLYTRKQRMNKLLVIYWPVLLLYYLVQGYFQTGELNIIMGFSLAIFPGLLVASVGMDAVDRKLPYKKYLILYPLLYPLTWWLHKEGFDFTTVAMPFAVGASLPVFHAAICLDFIDYKHTTRLQKLLGIILFGNAIHIINFAIFRMDPGAQLWGWIVSYLLCDLQAILLPSINLEITALTENDRLQKLVDEKTLELQRSLKVNESLFKVLIHDMSGPLMVINGYTRLLQQGYANPKELIDGIETAHNSLNEIIEQTKKKYVQKNKHNISLAPVKIDNCFKEISGLYQKALFDKKIILEVNNQLGSDTFVLAEQSSLTHSVLSNLISNGIKFTPHDSKVQISAVAKRNNVILEIKDGGEGIPSEIIKSIENDQQVTSSQGTSGEQGSGLGLSIVKFFVDAYGGKLEFIPATTGSIVRVTLKRIHP